MSICEYFRFVDLEYDLRFKHLPYRGEGMGSVFALLKFNRALSAQYVMSFWEHTSHDSKFSQCFNEATECNSRFVTSLLVNNKSFKGIFEGIETLVDVGGGNGTTVKAITEAYPWLMLSLLLLVMLPTVSPAHDN